MRPLDQAAVNDIAACAVTTYYIRKYEVIIMAQYTGKVWVLGDDIDTDIIIPTEYLALKTIEDMKQYGFSRCARSLRVRSNLETSL